jgi:hypothetical protein
METSSNSQSGRWALWLLLAAIAACTLALAPGARAGVLSLDLSPITLGPITVLDGVATVNGTVGGEPDAAVHLTINGQPVGVGLTGEFNAVVDLDGESVIELVLGTPATGEHSVLRIPLTLLGPGGTIAPSVLDPLRAAGIQIELPPGGFLTSDDGGLTVEGSLLNRDSLLTLTINGQQVNPGAGAGEFEVQVASGTREIVVAATASNGVSQTTTFPVSNVGSLITTSQGTSVTAAGADGVVITRIVYKANPETRRVRMIVTVKDRRGYLVRGAAVRVRGVPATAIVGGTTATLTNRVGKATLILRPRPSAFGTRLVTRTVAKVPSATALKTSSVRLPALAR